MAAERTVIHLACTVCKNRNYNFSYGRKRKYKVEVKKFCPKCRKHTLHKETK